MSALKTCKVGDCDVKVGEEALARIQKEIDWSKPDAAAGWIGPSGKLALDYTTAYLQGGNSRLAVYRDGKRPTFVAEEFTSMIGACRR